MLEAFSITLPDGVKPEEILPMVENMVAVSRAECIGDVGIKVWYVYHPSANNGRLEDEIRAAVRNYAYGKLEEKLRKSEPSEEWLNAQVEKLIGPFVKVAMIDKEVNPPTRKNSSDAGFDLYAAETVRLGYYQQALIPTGARFVIPPGWFGKVFDRSSLAKEGLQVTAGVIDQGYTGEVKILVTNTAGTMKVIEKNTRFAQIVFLPYYTGILQLIDESEIPTTERGSNAFGSTGIK